MFYFCDMTDLSDILIINLDYYIEPNMKIEVENSFRLMIHRVMLTKSCYNSILYYFSNVFLLFFFFRLTACGKNHNQKDVLVENDLPGCIHWSMNKCLRKINPYDFLNCTRLTIWLLKRLEMYVMCAFFILLTTILFS